MSWRQLPFLLYLSSLQPNSHFPPKLCCSILWTNSLHIILQYCHFRCCPIVYQGFHEILNPSFPWDSNPLLFIFTFSLNACFKMSSYPLKWQLMVCCFFCIFCIKLLVTFFQKIFRARMKIITLSRKNFNTLFT